MVFGILGECYISTRMLATTFTCFGIAEDHALQNVPGTGLLCDHGVVRGIEVDIDVTRDLKRGTGRHAHVILIPQPSDDPRDPYVHFADFVRDSAF